MELLVTWHPPRMAPSETIPGIFATLQVVNAIVDMKNFGQLLAERSEVQAGMPTGCPWLPWSCHEALENHVCSSYPASYPSLMCFEVNSEVFEHSWNISWVPQWFLRQKTKIEEYKMLDSLLDNKQPMHRNSGLGKKQVFIFCYYFHCVSF